MDIGERYTEAQMKQIERRLKSIYKEAEQDIKKKLNEFNEAHKARDAKYRAAVEAGEMSKEDYQAWLQGQVYQGKAWQNKKAQMAKSLYHANENAMSIVNGSRFDVFAENANWAEYRIAKGIKIDPGFGIYNQQAVARLVIEQPKLLPPSKVSYPKDMAWNMKKLGRALTQGIIQGEGIEKIAERMSDVTGSSRKAMVLHARTSMTGAQNAGRIYGMEAAQEFGINVKKQWMATLDDRTRDSHQELDGQVQDVDKPFDSILGPIMYPGDYSADPANVYNCFVGETNIATDSEIIRSYKHDYSGKLITVKTSSGVEFTCTPNHPILTPSGWVAAERLQDRNNLLIASIGEDDPLRINPYIEHAFTRIDAIHQLFDEMGSKRTARLGVNFHGDVPTTDVEIITQKRFLRNNRDSGCADSVNKLLLKDSDKSLVSKSASVQHFRGIRFAALRFMCGFGKALSLFGRRVIHAVVHGFRPIAWSDATVLQAQSDDVTGDVQFLRESLDGFSGKVFVDNIVNIKITTVSHVPVYNLQTGNSRYFVNSIIAQNKAKCNGKFAIAHNCRCTLIHVIDDRAFRGTRRDNITGEDVEDMTYEEWKNWKEGNSRETTSVQVKVDLSGIDKERGTIIGNTLSSLTQNYPLKNSPLQSVQSFRIAYGLEENADLIDFTDEHTEWEGVGAIFYPISTQAKGADRIEGPHITLFEIEEAGKESIGSLLSQLADIREKNGWHSAADSFFNTGIGVEGQFIHEYGHALANDCGIYWGGKHYPELEAIYKKYSKEDIGRMISIYASTNPQEMFAEAFVANMEPRLRNELTDEIMGLFTRLRGGK